MERLISNQDDLGEVGEQSPSSTLMNAHGSSLENTSAISNDLSDDSDYDSLFDAEDAAFQPCQPFTDAIDTIWMDQPARRSVPPISGLYLDPSILIPADIANQLWRDCMRTFFSSGDVNQVMLFERARGLKAEYTRESMEACTNGFHVGPEEPQSSRLPRFLLDLLDTLKDLLEGVVPPNIHTLLFPYDNDSHHARQVILNHYRPGEGITPHVDLLNRYSDGIIGVSLHGGTVMDFAKGMDSNESAAKSAQTNGVEVNSAVPVQPILLDESVVDPPEISPASYSVYLPERSVFVLSGEARYNWTHGISRRTEDFVESADGSSTERLPRGERLSITFRWLLPGADIVGD